MCLHNEAPRALPVQAILILTPNDHHYRTSAPSPTSCSFARETTLDWGKHKTFPKVLDPDNSSTTDREVIWSSPGCYIETFHLDAHTLDLSSIWTLKLHFVIHTNSLLMYEFNCTDNKQSNQIAFLRINFTFEVTFNQVRFKCYAYWMYKLSSQVHTGVLSGVYHRCVVHHNNPVTFATQKASKCLCVEHHICIIWNKLFFVKYFLPEKCLQILVEPL